MSNSFNQEPQYQGLQPAIPFERPLRSSTRSRTETPVRPPQVPQQYQQLTFPTPAIQQPSQQQQQQSVQQIAQQAQQLQPPRLFSNSPQAQQQADEGPSPLYHRITPGQKPRTREQILLDTQLEAEAHNHERSPHLAHHREQQRRLELQKEQIEQLERQKAYEKAQAAATMASRRSRKQRQEAPSKRGATQAQQPQQINNQGQPIIVSDDDEGDNDVQMQEAAPDGGASGRDDGEDSLPEEEGPWLAPLAQPILPLRLPSVRPTLLLGPYDTREDCHSAAQEYAIKQGFILVMRGSHKGKTSDGKYAHDKDFIRVDLKCDRGGTCTNKGTGLRRRKTARLGCPARFKLMRRTSNANKWFIEIICEEHNHDLDPNNMEMNAAYRRWKRKQEGRPAREPYKERYALVKKKREKEEGLSNPEPQLHQIGMQTETPTGPIHLAAFKGQYKILEILLDNGGDLKTKDAYGRTPLHCAVEGKKMDCVTLLVDRGADVTVLNNKGVSALHMAVEKGLEDAVVMFIEKGADPNRLAFYLTPDILSLCDELKRQRETAPKPRGRPRKTT